MRTLANIVTKGYKAIIIAWILFVAMMAVFAIRLPSMLEGDGFEMDQENAKVMDIVTEKFDLPRESLLLVFDDVKDERIHNVLKDVEKLEVTSEIISPTEVSELHKDHLSYAVLNFSKENQDMTKVVTQIRDVVKSEKGVTLTGGAAFTKDMNEASQRDLMTAEAIGLPIALIVLIFAFGSLIASIVPLIIGVSAVATAFGIMTLFSSTVDLSIFVMNIVPMLGLALSIDFALLMISRYREERKHDTILNAVQTTIQTAGRSVLFSAFCVIIGLGAMFVIRIDIFENIALGGMIVVAMAVFSSITLLPSILIALGDKLEKWRIIRVKENATDRWRKFAEGVIKRPVIIALIALIGLGVALIPVKNMVLTIPQIDSLPKSYDTREAFEKVEKAFKLDQESTVYLVADRKNGWTDEAGIEEIEKLAEKLAKDKQVKDATTIFSVSGIEDADMWQAVYATPKKAELEPLVEQFVKGKQLLIPVTLNVKGSSDEAQEWVRSLGNTYQDFDLMAGGEAKFSQEIFDEITDKIWLVLGIIVITTLIVLMYAFRSILIPIKAILMNVVGLAATFGILVYIFQYGHFGLPAGYIALIIPVIVFSLVFGLSMDYEVFLITRMQEEYAETQDNDKATVEGLAKTSKIITSAALIMIVITGAFAFTDVMPVKQIGVGIAIAVAIDATIIRLLLVPSLMKLLGKWNWWMPFRKGPYRMGSRH